MERVLGFEHRNNGGRKGAPSREDPNRTGAGKHIALDACAD